MSHWRSITGNVYALPLESVYSTLVKLWFRVMMQSATHRLTRLFASHSWQRRIFGKNHEHTPSTITPCYSLYLWRYPVFVSIYLSPKYTPWSSLYLWLWQLQSWVLLCSIDQCARIWELSSVLADRVPFSRSISLLWLSPHSLKWSSALLEEPKERTTHPLPCGPLLYSAILGNLDPHTNANWVQCEYWDL